MRRRDFIGGLGSAAAWPVAATAQQPALPVIGYLSGRSREAEGPMLTSFRQGLRETGYVENRDVEIEFRFADGDANRLPALASDLVHRQLAVIVAVGGNLSAPAARGAASKLPIVFNVGRDPVELGLVASFNRPGGYLTGIYTSTGVLLGKSLMLLHELAPKGTMIAMLISPQFAGATQFMKEAQDAAATLGLQLRVFTLSTDRDIDTAFASLMTQRPDAILVPTFPLSISRAQRITALAARVGVPAIYSRRDFAAAGGLELWGQRCRKLSPYRNLRWANTQGRQAGRPAGHPNEQVRTRHQPQDRQSTRPYHPGNAAGDRRRDNSMIGRRAGLVDNLSPPFATTQGTEAKEGNS